MLVIIITIIVIIVIVDFIIRSLFDSSFAQVTAMPELNLSSFAERVSSAVVGMFSGTDEDIAASLDNLPANFYASQRDRFYSKLAQMQRVTPRGDRAKLCKKIFEEYGSVISTEEKKRASRK